MDALIFLIPIALGLGLLGLGAFLWSLKSGQYDDMDVQPNAFCSTTTRRRTNRCA